DEVEPGQPLFELEGEKAVQEVEAVESGILHIPPESPRTGAAVSVGSLLAYLLQPGEPIPGALGSADQASPTRSAEGESGTEAHAEARPATGVTSAATLEQSASSSEAGGREYSRRMRSGDAGYSVTSSAHSATGKVIATPRARRIASELGVDW